MKLKRRKRVPMELDITSLLDILVILLVFLLKNYNASDLTLDLVKNIRLPSSNARVMGHYAAIIQVTKDQDIYLNNKFLINSKRSGAKISQLFDKLTEIKKQEIEKNINMPKEKQYKKNINIVIDKDVPYSEMKKVMNTAAIVGYTNFKFIVKGNY